MSETTTKPKATVNDLQERPQEPRPPRVKPLRTKADVDEVPYFDDEDRAAAYATLTRSIDVYGNQPTIGVCCAMHDPLMAAAKFRYGEELQRLVDNVGAKRHTRQGTLLHLMTLMVMKEVGDENLTGALIAGNGNKTDAWRPHHLALMDFPESEVWTPEQSLMLRYTRALLDHDVSDALWDEVVATWGVKMAIRYIHHLGHFWTTGLRNRVLRVPHPLYRER